MKWIGALAAALLVLAGCTEEGPEPRPDPEPAPEASATESPGEAETEETPGEVAGPKIPVQVWFLDPDMKLLLHYAEVPPTQAIGRAALEELLRGVPPDLADSSPARSAIPEGTELLGLTVEGGTAVVDLSRDFENTGLGSAADGVQIAQVVYTLTQFPSVKKVEFQIEGERVEAIGGHGVIVDEPQTRKDWESALPPIVVETPYADQELTPPFTITGIANVFEATVSYRIRNAEGKIIDKGFTTATCGTGCYGTFSQVVSLDIDLPARVVVEVFESSAENGRPLNMQKIPLNLEPAA